MASVYRRKYRDPKTGRPRRCRTYTIEWQDAQGRWHREGTDYTDKESARQYAINLEKEAAQNTQGLRDSYENQKNRPIGEHVGDYLADSLTLQADSVLVYRCPKCIYNWKNFCAKITGRKYPAILLFMNRKAKK